MFRPILCSDQENLGKNTEINKESQVKFWFNRKNKELSHIYLAVHSFYFLTGFLISFPFPMTDFLKNSTAISFFQQKFLKNSNDI